jgi:plasmid stabilization system protein ParE
MPKYKIEFTQKSTAQIRSIFSGICADSAAAALKAAGKIEKHIALLADNPGLGAELPEDKYPFLTPGYRKLICKPFLVYYRVIGQTVFITHVVRERRDQGAALRKR